MPKLQNDIRALNTIGTTFSMTIDDGYESFLSYKAEEIVEGIQGS